MTESSGHSIEGKPSEVIYACDVDGTGSMHMCSKDDKGAVAYIRDDVALEAMECGSSSGEPLEAMEASQ